MEQYVKDFIERTKQHIARVNKYGKIIGKDYSNHDSDKLTDLLDDYALMKKKTEKVYGVNGDDPTGLTEEEQERLNKATAHHITYNQHHPEFWCKEKDAIKSFDRFNPPKGLHCEDMSNEALEEMCADWCAMSEEFGNTPFSWFNKTVPDRWVFTKQQELFILTTLTKMWENK